MRTCLSGLLVVAGAAAAAVAVVVTVVAVLPGSVGAEGGVAGAETEPALQRECNPATLDELQACFATTQGRVTLTTQLLDNVSKSTSAAHLEGAGDRGPPPVVFHGVDLDRGDTSIVAITEALKMLGTTSLVIWKPSHVSASVLSAMLMPHSGRLRELTLSDLSLQAPAAMDVLSDVLRHSEHLEVLILRDVRLETHHIHTLLDALPTSLRHLEVSSMDKGSYASYLELEAAQALGRRQDMQLEHIVLSGLEIDDDACLALASGFSSTPTLRTASLHDNHVADACAQGIADLCEAGALDHLHLLVLTLNRISAPLQQALYASCAPRGIIVDTYRNTSRQQTLFGHKPAQAS